jgi:hypothetical protein
MKTTLTQALRTAVATLGLGMLVLSSAPSWAADMCLLDDYNSTFVGKNFSFPAAGACKGFDGYELGTNCIISGTACGTSDNSTIAFHLTTSCPFVNYQGIHSFRIDRLYSNINQAGYGYAVQLPSGYTSTWHIKTVPCPTPRPLN